MVIGYIFPLNLPTVVHRGGLCLLCVQAGTADKMEPATSIYSGIYFYNDQSRKSRMRWWMKAWPGNTPPLTPPLYIDEHNYSHRFNYKALLRHSYRASLRSEDLWIIRMDKKKQRKSSH